MAVRALAFHKGTLSSIPGGVTQGFSHVVIMSDRSCWSAVFLRSSPVSPRWTKVLSRVGPTIISQALLEMVKVAEKMINFHHGTGIGKERGVVKNFIARLVKKIS